MSQKIIIPKVIDPHVHARDLDQSETMTILQNFKEAVKSGIGTVCLMPNTAPSIDNETVLNLYLNKIEDAERATGVSGYVWVALTDTNHDEVIKMLRYKKVLGVKIYPLGVTTGTCGIRKWNSFEKLLKLMQEKGIDKPIAGHWEDPEIIEIEGHSVNAEVSAFKKLVEVVRKYPNFRYTACHVTTAKGGNILEDAQEDGLQIMIEITNHHLYFCSDEVDVTDAKYKCFPPIKSYEDRKWLRNFVKDHADHQLISIGSDTAPHLKTAKEQENPPGGLATQQHIIPVMLTLQEELGLDAFSIGNLTSNNAARFLGIPESKERVAWELVSYIDEKVYNKGKVINPFEGEKLIGKLTKGA
jgi:dihydroorotase